MTRRHWALPALVGLGLCIWYISRLAPTVTTAYGGADGGELATAIWSGGVPHPPGYPTYWLFGRVALLLPSGEPAWRLGLLSALAAAACATILGWAVNLLQPQASSGAGAAAALLLGLNPRFNEQALIVEVYPLALAFFLLLFWLTARWLRWRDRRTASALGLVLGLGLGVQLPILAWCAGAALLAWPARQRWRDWPWLRFGSAVLLGGSVYALLFWRGNAVPAHSWGDWSSLAGGWAQISAAEYQYLAGVVPWGQRLSRLSFIAGDLVRGLGIGGSALALVGIIWSEVPPGWRRLSLGCALATLGWAISYGGADGTVYTLPLHALAALWAGHGAQWLLSRSPQTARHWAAGAMLLIGLLQPARPRVSSLAASTGDRDQAQARLERLPPQAVLRTSDDRITFPLWYVQTVLGVRPDVQIIDTRLEQRAWYRQNWLQQP